MSGNRPRSDKVLKGECVKGPLRTAGGLDSIVDISGHWIGPMRIVMSGVGILHRVQRFFPLVMGAVTVTKAHDPWAIHCSTTVLYSPWPMEVRLLYNP